MRGFDRHILRTRVCSHTVFSATDEIVRRLPLVVPMREDGDDASVVGMRGCVLCTRTRIEHDAYLAFSPDVSACACILYVRAYLARTTYAEVLGLRTDHRPAFFTRANHTLENGRQRRRRRAAVLEPAR